MKWHDTAALVGRAALRLVGPIVAGLLAARLTLAGVPDECAAQVAAAAGKLFGW